MRRIRLSTTVDRDLLESARAASTSRNDASLIDQALATFLAEQRSAEIDQSYEAYDVHPLEEPDAWGDLASFREAAASS